MVLSSEAGLWVGGAPRGTVGRGSGDWRPAALLHNKEVEEQATSHVRLRGGLGSARGEPVGEKGFYF